MYGVPGRDGRMGVVGMPVLEEHSQIDLPQHVDTARGSQIQAASCGSVCVTEDLLHEEWWQKVWMCRRDGKA